MASSAKGEPIFPKWSNRGTTKCPQCVHVYSTARKPKYCANCKFELGGSYVQKTKMHMPECVIVYRESNTSLYSIKSSTRDDRCLVLVEGEKCLCYHETCKQQRAIHVSSDTGRQFSCKHSEKIDGYSKPDEPLEKYFLSAENIETYPADNSTRNTLTSLLEDLSASPAAMKLTDKTFVVFGRATTSTPMCYTHVQFNQGNHSCLSKDCRHRGGNTKQVKSKHICIHIHVLLCVLPGDVKSAGPAVPSSEAILSQDYVVPPPISRVKTVELMSRYSVPYPVPSEYITRGRNLDAWTTVGLKEKAWPTTFEPIQESCELCGAELDLPKVKPGSDGDAFLMTSQHQFCVVKVLVKFCGNSECKAMHRVWPLCQGLFNINDKLLLALEVLIQWRELFKRGVPVKVFIEGTVHSWVNTSPSNVCLPSTGQQKYLVDLMYNGFYCFEAMTERSLDDVVCGICGIAGEVYCGDGNEKNCCDLNGVDYSNNESSGDPVSLEEFLNRIKHYWVEKTVYTKAELDDARVDAATIPPIIAPAARASKVYNTEMEKKSVYLKEKNTINGDPAILHSLIKSMSLEISDIESWSIDVLKSTCVSCGIKITGMSKALMAVELRALYATLLVGNSPCHEFTKVKGHTGGFYHFVCRHGTTVGSKFLTLQESVRDAADIYLSLKYPPITFVNDTPCTFSRHLDLRVPNVTRFLWGDNAGCFEVPSLDKCPEKVSIPYLVPLEFNYAGINYKPEDKLEAWEHPVNGMKRRFVVGDRFHSSTNPHKSPLCRFHDLDLCEQKNAIKTSYQESENNRKNFLRLRSSTMQKFFVHFYYNYLMDFYQNENILQNLKNKMVPSLRADEQLIRGQYLKFVVVKK